MYEQFFRLQRRPFAGTPDPACLFSSESLAEVLDQLNVCVEHGQGIGILTAPAGMGKTLLCQRLARNLSRRYRCILLGSASFPTRRSLLQAILFEVGVEFSRKDEQELRHELRTVLNEIRTEREAVVLIVDEAHLFEVELLEEIRTLVDLAENGQPLVRVILSGQLELEERMTDRQFDAINQRISTHAVLEPLSITESVGYLRHRIEWAGGNPDEMISDAGTMIIARASCGVPRCLNQLADHSLLLGFAADESPVSEKTVREALEDLKQLPLHWNDVNDADRIFETHSDSDEVAAEESVDIEESWEADSSIPAMPSDDASAPTRHESQSDGDSETDSAESTVFEFGADESRLDDHDEGDTLDEAAASIEVPVAGSSDTAEAEVQEEDEPLESVVNSVDELDGEPALPVAQISGVVLNLSSGVCGVSECTGGIVEVTRVATKSNSTARPEFNVDPSAVDARSGEVVSDVAPLPPTAVFEFGGSEPEFVAEPDLEAESEMESDMKSDEPREPGELADSDDSQEVGPDVDVAADHGESAGEAPSEEVVLAEIAAVQREIAQVTEEFEADPEFAANDAESVVMFDEAAASNEEGQSDFAEKDEPARTRSDAGFELEVVSDPYALIQEPLSAGIVWKSSASSQTHGESEASQKEADSEVAGLTVNEESVASEKFGEGVSQEAFADEENEETATGSGSEGPAKDAAELDSHKLSVQARIESDQAIFESCGDTIAEGLGEAIMQDWNDDSPEPADFDMVEEPAAELSLFEADSQCNFEARDVRGSDVEELTPTREIHPARYIEAIVPMLGEIDESHAPTDSSPDTPERQAIDIEAELVETISADDADIEDEIGATVLDICLETQWGIQQSNGGVAEDSRRKSRPHAVGDYEPEPESYDIVEPEESVAADCSVIDHFSDVGPIDERDGNSSPGSRDQESRRPFGRLFSELRRRSSRS